MQLEIVLFKQVDVNLRMVAALKDHSDIRLAARQGFITGFQLVA